MTRKEMEKVLSDLSYVRTGGSPEELKAAKYLKKLCENMGAKATIEKFPVQMADIEKAVLKIDGKEIPCKGYKNSGSGKVKGAFLYLGNVDPVTLRDAKGKIVLIDTGITYFVYEDLLNAGVKGIITYDGNVNFADSDIDAKELRGYVRDDREKILSVNINAKDALRIMGNNPKEAEIEIREEEYIGESRNVVAFLPGKTDESIVLTAHYDSTPLSQGVYDNMTGSVGLLAVLDTLKKTAPNRYGIYFVFCGSEERGLLGSKAYVTMHEKELEKYVLNVNLDMIGSAMGKFLCCVTAEEKLTHYIEYYAALKGFGIRAYNGVYSSDSTPFADKKVPAISFARIAGGNIAPIHNRYDTKLVVNSSMLSSDCDFIIGFVKEMANAAKCPVSREFPDSVLEELDVYLNRKRKK